MNENIRISPRTFMPNSLSVPRIANFRYQNRLGMLHVKIRVPKKAKSQLFIRPHMALKFGRTFKTHPMQAGLTNKPLTFREIFLVKSLFVLLILEQLSMSELKAEKCLELATADDGSNMNRPRYPHPRSHYRVSIQGLVDIHRASRLLRPGRDTRY